MTAGDKYQYLWMDGVAMKKPTSVSAPRYVDLLLTWVESQLNDEALFPIRFDAPFPKRFKEAVCGPIYRRSSRIYSHVYHHHYTRIVDMGAEAHLNTCFKHFIYFVYEVSTQQQHT